MSRYRNIILAVLPPLFLGQASAWAEGDPEKGRALSLEHCTRCHVVGDYNPMGGIGSTPSFQLLRGMKDWRERFESFYARRPHPVHVRVEGLPKLTDLPPNAAPFTITISDVEHIVSFVETMPHGQTSKP